MSEKPELRQGNVPNNESALPLKKKPYWIKSQAVIVRK
jgi:hypothetical protein